MIELERIRSETPGIRDKLFFNSAGSSLPPRLVLQETEEYLRKEAILGGYEMADLYQEKIDRFYDQSATLINAHPRNMAFAHDATHAFSKALSAIPFKPGEVILTTQDDYVSNYLHFIGLQKRFGIQIERIQTLANGDLDLNDAQSKLKKLNPKVVSVTHIPTNSGLIQNVVGMGELCKENDTVYMVDACQSIGQLPLDVQEIGCDFLSVTGRKFLRGPRGTGFLYVSDGMLDRDMAPLFVDLKGAKWIDEKQYALRSDAQRFETWEAPYALLMGLTAAIDYALSIGLEWIAHRNEILSNQLREGIRETGVCQLLDRGSQQASIITWIHQNTSIEKIITILKEQQVYFSISDRHSALLDFREKNVHQAIRCSPHYFNNSEEIDQLIEIIKTIE